MSVNGALWTQNKQFKANASYADSGTCTASNQRGLGVAYFGLGLGHNATVVWCGDGATWEQNGNTIMTLVNSKGE